MFQKKIARLLQIFRMEAKVSRIESSVTFKVERDLLDHGSTCEYFTFDEKNKKALAIDLTIKKKKKEKKSGIEQCEDRDTVFIDARVFLERKRERGSVSTSSSKSN